MSEVSCVAISLAKPGCEDQLYEALNALIEPTHNEIGVIQYDLHRDLDEPRRFIFLERWIDKECFDTHCGAPHVMAYLQKTGDFLEHSEFHPMTKLG